MNEHQYPQAIYREYLMEASCLYDQRGYLLDDPEYDWPDLERFESRLETQINSLADGGEDALPVCAAVPSGDAGELHAALRVFCRLERFDLVRSLFARLDPRNAETLEAACSALAMDMPCAFEAEWLDVLCEAHAPIAPHLVAWVIAHRRLNRSKQLCLLIESARDAATLKVLLRTAGRTPAAGFNRDTLLSKLHVVLEHEDADVRREAALALLRLGDAGVLDACRAQVKESETWPCIALGLGGEPNDVFLLLRITERQPSPDCLTALGFLGDIRAVPPLLKHLAVPAFAESAAQSLWLITGADLFEQVFIPAKFELDELFDDEREKYEKGEFVPPPNMRGATITRISQNQTAWRAWWAENKGTFDASIRYRSGKPCCPAHGPTVLAHPKTRRWLRELAACELAIRYGIDTPFETVMPVHAQRDALRKISSGLASVKGAFPAGGGQA